MPRSGIREIMDCAWGRPGVIRLEVGEPNFPTPAHIVEAAHTAALEGQTGYTLTAGIPPLREALADKVRECNGFVLAPDPAWPNFLMMARLLNPTVVTYPLTEDTAGPNRPARG